MSNETIKNFDIKIKLRGGVRLIYEWRTSHFSWQL